MTQAIGTQYDQDDAFKAAARLHQSRYRAAVLKVGFSEYGNRLTEENGRALLNYYDRLGVRETLRQRYRHFSNKRDSDMLRSEHMPFNLFAPLLKKPDLTQDVLKSAFGINLVGPFTIRFEWAPKPAENYINDRTSFDTYIQGFNTSGKMVGVGIEVKYTERGYRIGTTEAIRVRDPKSVYWATTRESGLFASDGSDRLGHDDLRQIWRNHLLGLTMIRHGDVSDFMSVTLHPSGKKHIAVAINEYKNLLKEKSSTCVQGCTFEKFIDTLSGDSEVESWKRFLAERYVIEQPV